ncbi:MAG: radical SAM protein [Candidatus Marinimicrobia bacterium]|nr:radical SAM protein [Candidatus Neomarinimicrobiota bacterium]MCH8068467.1 radical SAM protein [Candidatus Neomarinimicrobiota bacterium]
MYGVELRTAGYRIKNGSRAFRKLVIPYIQSRIHGYEFRPLLSYLYTEWKCNIDCHYCFQFNNKVKGMSIETAIQSIDWLKTTGCRLIAIMGGEPLLRRNFILEVVEYAAKSGFFVYLPTNGRLLTEDFIDRVGQAGVTAINLAVDCVEEIDGLPKALKLIEPQFKYLVKQQKKHGYLVFLNVNITSKNLEDVKQLTEVTHEYRIGIDYHINQPPYLEQTHYKHLDNDTYIREEHWNAVDKVIDWIISKNKQGYPMVNSIAHLEAMKKFVRGELVQWSCRAGHNTMFIRVDGTLVPCFDMTSSKKDWGNVFTGYRFNPRGLKAMKQECIKHCLSTCHYNMSHYYDTFARSLKWATKHARIG